MKKRIFSRLMAMIMALSLLSTTGFAASFSALQDAIDGGVAEAGSDEHANGTKFNKENDTTDYYGYAWNQNESRWGIEAWDNGDTRNVALNEDVKFDKDGEDKDRSKINGGIAIVGDKNVAIELNGHEINLNPDAKLDAQSEKFVDKDGQEVSREDLNKGSVIWMSGGADLTVTDSTALKLDENGEAVLDEDGNFRYVAEQGTGAITGGNNVAQAWNYQGTNYAGWKYMGAGVTFADGGSFTMKGGSITGNWGKGRGGIVGYKVEKIELTGTEISNNIGGNGGGILISNVQNSSITDTVFKGNVARNVGSAISATGSGTMNIKNCEITENISHYETLKFHETVNATIENTKIHFNTANHSNVITVESGVSLIMKNSSIQDNTTSSYAINRFEDETMSNVSICNNKNAEGELRPVYPGGGDLYSKHRDLDWELTRITKAPTCTVAGKGIYTCKHCEETKTDTVPATGHKPVTDEAATPTCTEIGLTAGSHCSACGEVFAAQTEIPALGHEYGDWYVTREAQPGVAGEERHDCVRGDAFETRPIAALPMPVEFGDGAGTDTTIDDEATPLAGLFTRADAIGYLWEHTGSPEAELSTFADVPEDHYWAVAIGWAEDNGIALPDEEGNFRPDDLVLRTSDEPEGELQEFLNRYAVFAGIELDEGELFFVLDGAADDIIMGEDAQVIFDAFFAKLEKTLAEQEKAA